MYRIGIFSKMSKTTVKTLRYYEEVGLLKPAKKDPFTGYRFYEANQLFDLHRMISLKQTGFTIEEILEICALEKKAEPAKEKVTSILNKRKELLLQEIREKEQSLSRLEFLISQKQEDKWMCYVATIKELPECFVYSKKMRVKDYQSYFQLIPQIGQQVMEKYPQLKCAVPEYCFISYLDGEYKEKDFQIELCEAVVEIMEDFEDIHFKKIPAIKALSVMHKGPYSELSKAYAFALCWMEENNYQAADVPRESYIDGIWNKESEEEWLTELQIPIL